MGIEVVLILYSLKILYPDLVHFNRGNHEQRRLNEKYGFAYEVRSKYDKVSSQNFGIPNCSGITRCDNKFLG